MDIVRYTAQDEVIVSSQDITLIPTLNIQSLVDAFINSQDVKLSSKNLYRRTLKQYFNWVDTTNYLLNEICLLYTSDAADE